MHAALARKVQLQLGAATVPLAMPPTTFEILLAFEPLSFWSGLNHAFGLTPAFDVI